MRSGIANEMNQLHGKDAPAPVAEDEHRYREVPAATRVYGGARHGELGIVPVTALTGPSLRVRRSLTIAGRRDSVCQGACTISGADPMGRGCCPTRSLSDDGLLIAR